MKMISRFFQHFFTPREENNFRAKAIHPDFLMYYLVVALVLTFSFKYVNTHFSSVLGFATDISIDKLFQLTNQQREKNNLSLFSYNEKLSEAAYKKAQDMFRKNYWAHYGPDGVTPWDFILSQGYQYEYAGENLAKNFLYSSGVVDAWMNSKAGHRENILRKEYTEVGFAVVNGMLNGEETTLVVQMFGKPLASPLAKQVPQKTVEQSPLVQGARNQQKNTINLFTLSFQYNLVFILFLLLVLAMDFYFATKFHIVRVSGKNTAHFVFLVFILLGVFMVTKGTIL